MDDDLVLLTSYFNLANGRRQDTADTFRVDPSLPSRTSPDGTAALYIVTESSGAGQMGPRVRRLAADTIAWEYSTHGEEPPAARLKAALRTAHEVIMREFDGHVSVGASVIAVEHRDVYLAQVAPAQVYVLHAGSLNSISASADGSSPFAHALGAAGGPQIVVFRDEIGVRDVLALCSSWFHRTADPEDLRECFGAGTADDIAECLLDLGQQHDVRDASVIVIEAALASDLESIPRSEAPGFLEQVDTAVQALASVGKMLLSELRPPPRDGYSDDSGAPVADGAVATEIVPGSGSRPVHPRTAGDRVPARTPRHDDQATTEIPAVHPYVDEERAAPWNPDETATWDLSELHSAEGERSPAPAPEQITQEVPAVSESAGAPEYEETTEEAEPERPAIDLSDQGGAEDTSVPAAVAREREAAEAVDLPYEAREVEPPPRKHRAEREETPVSELEQVNSRLQSSPDMGDVIPPVQAFPDTGTEPSRIYATSKDIQAVNRRPRRFGGIARPAREPASSPSVIRPGVGDLDLRKPVSRPAPPAVVWFAAAIICLFAVFAGYEFLNHRNHAVATDPYPAKFARNIRLALASTAPNTQDLYLGKAQQDIALARQFGDTPANLRRLRDQLAATKDSLYHITREASPVVLTKLQQLQQPTEIAVSPDTVYVLDTGKKAVFSVPPNPTSSATEIIQAGETDSGFTFGTPTHIATSGSTVLALDNSSQNILVRYSAGTKTATSLAPTSPGQRIVAMANYGPDVYLLDAAGNQVWRYPDAVQGYNPTPGAFFSPSSPNSGQPVSFTLDDKALYILDSSGKVLKFDTLQANPLPFATAGLRVPLRHANGVFTDVGLPYIWIADPGNARIVQLDKSTGRYIRSYVAGAGSGMNLSQVRGLAVQPDDKFLFVLAGTQVFKFPVTP